MFRSPRIWRTAWQPLTQAKHRLKVTVTTPAWIDNDEYYLLVLTIDTNSAVIELMGAVANFTLRLRCSHGIRT